MALQLLALYWLMGETHRSEAMVGRYHLHREIAKGGMARIHIARSVGSHGFSRLVAAKRLDPQLASDDEFVEMFLDEARVASKVRHRNVVPVLDVVTIDGEVIMVQELVHGVALHKLFSRAQLENTRIPVDIAVSIAAQVLAGLHAAHEAVDETGESLHIVHRDVSPQNVMIASDGMARLLDFGVAKASAIAQLHVTRAGTFKGKVSYSSPEHLLATATRQSDVYSLAIVLWELLVGERLYAGRPDPEVFTAIVESSPPAVTDVLAAERAAGLIDDTTWLQLVAVEPILRRAFARDLAERFATAADMERALLAAVTPAPLADIAAWMRGLANDLLVQTEQLIAAEEASWRKWRDGGCVPVLAQGTGSVPTLPALPAAEGTPAATPREYPRRSTSLETKAIKPNAGVSLWQQRRREQRAAAQGSVRERHAQMGRTARARGGNPLHADLLAIACVLMLLLLAAMPAIAGVPGAPARAAVLDVTSANEVAAMETAVSSRVRPPAAVSATNARADEARPSKKRSTARRAAAKRAVERTEEAPLDCATPFYYEGAKKRFKPRCL